MCVYDCDKMGSQPQITVIIVFIMLIMNFIRYII